MIEIYGPEGIAEQLALPSLRAQLEADPGLVRYAGRLVLLHGAWREPRVPLRETPRSLFGRAR